MTVLAADFSFPSSLQNQPGCSFFPCRVPRVFPRVSPAERLPAPQLCPAAASGRPTRGSSDASGTSTGNSRGSRGTEGDGGGRISLQKANACPRSSNALAGGSLWEGARCGSEPRGPRLAAGGDGAEPQPDPRGPPPEPQEAMAGWFGPLHHARDVERAVGRIGDPRHALRGQREPWPGERGWPGDSGEGALTRSPGQGAAGSTGDGSCSSLPSRLPPGDGPSRTWSPANPSPAPAALRGPVLPQQSRLPGEAFSPPKGPGRAGQDFTLCSLLLSLARSPAGPSPRSRVLGVVLVAPYHTRDSLVRLRAV